MWPEKFPLIRTVIALVLVPPVTITIWMLWPQIWHHPKFVAPGELWSARDLLYVPLVAIVFSWPGYIAFAALGLPTLYVLYHLRKASFLLFGVLGAVYFCMAWDVFMLWSHRGGRPDPIMLWPSGYFAATGAFGGVLTRMIVIGLGVRKEMGARLTH